MTPGCWMVSFSFCRCQFFLSIPPRPLPFSKARLMAALSTDESLEVVLAQHDPSLTTEVELQQAGAPCEGGVVHHTDEILQLQGDLLGVGTRTHLVLDQVVVG